MVTQSRLIEQLRLMKGIGVTEGWLRQRGIASPSVLVVELLYKGYKTRLEGERPNRRLIYEGRAEPLDEGGSQLRLDING